MAHFNSGNLAFMARIDTLVLRQKNGKARRKTPKDGTITPEVKQALARIDRWSDARLSRVFNYKGELSGG